MKDFDRYLPHTEEDVRKILDAIGMESLEDLFDAIPKEHKLSKPLNLPEAFSEPDLVHHFQGLESARMSSFLRAGAYHHFIPAVVSNLASRSEFYTAYTPYQPEISQGTLQAIFEYQTLMRQLMGKEVSNASMYEEPSLGLAPLVVCTFLILYGISERQGLPSWS